MPNDRLTLQIDTVTTGQEHIDALSGALNKVVSIAERSGSSLKAAGQTNPFANFPTQIKQFAIDPLTAAEAAAGRFASSLTGIGAVAGGAAAGLLAIGAASLTATRSLADLGIQTQAISLKTGLTTKEVGQFSFAARAAGADVEMFQTAMRKLSAGLVDGGEDGKKAASALQSLGIQSRTVNGDIRPLGEIFEQIGAKLAGIDSPAQRAKLAVDMFGRSGIELIPTLISLNSHIERAKQLGIGLSDSEIQKLDGYKQKLAELDAKWDVLGRKFKEGIAGTVTISILTSIADFLSGKTDSSGKRVSNVDEHGTYQFLLPMRDGTPGNWAPGLGAGPWGKPGPRRPNPEDVTANKRWNDLWYGPLLDPRGSMGLPPVPMPRVGGSAEISRNAADVTADLAAGTAFASRFAASRLGTPEGLQAQIQKLEEENSNLAATIAPGIGGKAAADSAGKISANQRTIDSLKAQLKSLEDITAQAAQLKKQAADVTFADETPVDKIYRSLLGPNKVNSLGYANILAAAELGRMAKDQEKFPLTLTGLQGYRAPGAGFAFPDRSSKPGIETRGEYQAGALGSGVGGSVDENGNYAPSKGADQALKATEAQARLMLDLLKSSNSLSDEMARKSGAEKASSVDRQSSFASRMIAVNPMLAESQKISAEYRIQLGYADQRYKIELAMAASLSTEDERKKAANQADLDNALRVQEIKEQAVERLAALEAKKLEDFGTLIGGIFDAVTSRRPGAIPNFFRSQALDMGKTITENAAKTFIFPMLSTGLKQIAPDPNSTMGQLFKGTFLEGSSKDAALVANTAALKLLTTTLIGRGGALQTSATGSPLVAGYTATGMPAIADTVDGLPVNFGPQNLSMPSISSSPATMAAKLTSVFGGFGAGLTSVASGNALATLLGENTTGPTTTSGQIGAGVGLTGLLAGGGFGIYSGLQQGGVGGDLKAAGSAAGLVGGIVGNVSKLLDVASPLLGAIPIVGSLAAMALPLIGGLFNGPQQRANAINSELSSNQYIAPQAMNVTESSAGTFASFDARGNMRSSDFSPYPQERQGFLWEQTHGLFDGPPTYYTVPGTQTSQFGAPVAPPPPQPVQHIYMIQAIDTQSFDDAMQKHSYSVGTAAAKALQDGHDNLSTQVQRYAGLH